MPALYPSMVAPEDFQVGQAVRKFITESAITPYAGVVTHVTPTTYKVWVQWPDGNTQEDPGSLIKINPAIFGMPSTFMDSGYDSIEKSLSEKVHGVLPKTRKKPGAMPSCGCFRMSSTDKMVIRIAHTFATNVVGKLVDDICVCQKKGMSDLQTYNAIFAKYEDICSDHIIRGSIQKIYGV